MPVDGRTNFAADSYPQAAWLVQQLALYQL
jgi:hypothetical protein